VVSPLTFRCKFCIPLGTSFELLRLIFRRYLALHSLRDDFRASPCFFSFSALDGACSYFTFYIFLGDFALVELDKKGKITNYGPLKTFLPLWKGKGCHRKNEKDYIKLHIISSKLIRIPRSRNVVVVHILQSVRTGS
jgi:hypothetical protein